MPRFLIGNGITGDCFELEARSAEAACRDLGWRFEECVVVQLPETASRPGGSREPIVSKTER